MAWYSGMEGGHALADVVLGQVDATGRLPFSIPTDQAHLPPFDRDATAITYDRWYGQRLLDRLGVPAAYPLGFGLSYTTFELDGAAAEQDGPESLRARTTVNNTGGRDGRHVAQVYGVRLDGDRAGERALLGFAPVQVPAGGSQDLTVSASGDPNRQETELTLP
jgi:beta-glucosidase